MARRPFLTLPLLIVLWSLASPAVVNADCLPGWGAFPTTKDFAEAYPTIVLGTVTAVRLHGTGYAIHVEQVVRGHPMLAAGTYRFGPATDPGPVVDNGCVPSPMDLGERGIFGVGGPIQADGQSLIAYGELQILDGGVELDDRTVSLAEAIRRLRGALPETDITAGPRPAPADTPTPLQIMLGLAFGTIVAIGILRRARIAAAGE